MFIIFERRRGPPNVAGPGKTSSLPPSPLSTGLSPGVARRSHAATLHVRLTAAPAAAVMRQFTDDEELIITD